MKAGEIAKKAINKVAFARFGTIKKFKELSDVTIAKLYNRKVNNKNEAKKLIKLLDSEESESLYEAFLKKEPLLN